MRKIVEWYVACYGVDVPAGNALIQDAASMPARQACHD